MYSASLPVITIIAAMPKLPENSLIWGGLCHFSMQLCSLSRIGGGDILVCIWLLLSLPIYVNVIGSSVFVKVEKIVLHVVVEIILELNLKKRVIQKHVFFFGVLKYINSQILA